MLVLANIQHTIAGFWLQQQHAKIVCVSENPPFSDIFILFSWYHWFFYPAGSSPLLKHEEWRVEWKRSGAHLHHPSPLSLAHLHHHHQHNRARLTSYLNIYFCSWTKRINKNSRTTTLFKYIKCSYFTGVLRCLLHTAEISWNGRVLVFMLDQHIAKHVNQVEQRRPETQALA